VLVGKGNHLFPEVRETIDELRRRHPQCIVIDMGWPSDDRRYADIATFGASRHVGDALLAWLEASSQIVHATEKESL
jgi:beta-N-acetylhexosaminidase